MPIPVIKLLKGEWDRISKFAVSIRIMANHKSALKRIRQNDKRRIHNRGFRNRARTLVKQSREIIEAGSIEEAREATRLACRDLDMAASKGIIHPKNAARRKGRLMKQLAKLEA